jgi:hypothetical protein
VAGDFCVHVGACPKQVDVDVKPRKSAIKNLEARMGTTFKLRPRGVLVLMIYLRQGPPRERGLTSFGLTGMSSELVSCSCEALAGSLLPVFVGVKFIFEQHGVLRAALRAPGRPRYYGRNKLSVVLLVYG